jgi:hypothetical protein
MPKTNARKQREMAVAHALAGQAASVRRKRPPRIRAPQPPEAAASLLPQSGPPDSPAAAPPRVWPAIPCGWLDRSQWSPGAI